MAALAYANANSALALAMFTFCGQSGEGKELEELAVGKPQDMFASCPGDASQQAPPAACCRFISIHVMQFNCAALKHASAWGICKVSVGFFGSKDEAAALLPCFPACACGSCKDSTCGRVDLTACPGSHNYAISCQHAGQLEVAGNAQSGQRSRRAFAS